MRPAKLPVLITLITLFSILPLTQCTRSEEADDAAERVEDDAGPEVEGQTMRLTEAGRERQRPDEEGSAPAAQGAVRSERTAMTIDPQDSAFAAHRLAAPPLYPVDFRIGSLRTGGLSSMERAARAAGRELLVRALGSDELPSDTATELSAGGRFLLEEIAGSDFPPDGVRLGRPQMLADGEVSLLFRLTGRQSGWSGELILEMAGGQWYTSDIQVNKSGFDRVEPFVPGIDEPGARW